MNSQAGKPASQFYMYFTYSAYLWMQVADNWGSVVWMILVLHYFPV